MPEIDSPIAYSPRMLVGLKNITSYFNVGQDTVYRWLDEGAPIIVEHSRGKPRYTAEAMLLYHWRLGRSRRVC